MSNDEFVQLIADVNISMERCRDSVYRLSEFCNGELKATTDFSLAALVYIVAALRVVGYSSEKALALASISVAKVYDDTTTVKKVPASESN